MTHAFIDEKYAQQCWVKAFIFCGTRNGKKIYIMDFILNKTIFSSREEKV